ncbi:MAG: hypothetical protein GXO43_04645, partial [Crenarchaeota archaeon]|nr:hypothetical protein [Thermoproteota archaeon]
MIIDPDEIRLGSSRLIFPGHSSNVVIRPLERVASLNYFIGSDPSKWKKDVPIYKGVVLENLYPGIDLRIIGTRDNNFKLQWNVKPGADPRLIELLVRGPGGAHLDGEGNIASKGWFVEKPRAFQGSQEIEVAYRKRGERFVLHIGEYDSKQLLVIDPSVVVGGGSLQLELKDMEIYNGDVYVVFDSKSTIGLNGISGYETEGDKNSKDIVILKLSSDLSSVVAGTILGGSGKEEAFDMDISPNGLYVVGRTGSSDFPVVAGAYDRTKNRFWDAFVSRFSLDLENLISSTYLGEDKDDEARAVLVTDDAVYVAGRTRSRDFPTTFGAYRPTFIGGRQDGFISRFDFKLTSLEASTFIGGSDDRRMEKEKVTALFFHNNLIYFAGSTESDDFPVDYVYTDGICKGEKGFVARINPHLTSLEGSALVCGSSRLEYVNSLLVSDSMVFIAGQTNSTDFPLINAVDASITPIDSIIKDEGFISGLSQNLDTLVFSTYLGGEDDDEVYKIFLDEANGVLYAVGYTASTDFPITPSAYQNVNEGSKDAFITAIDINSYGLLYSTYLGGAGNDEAKGLFVLNSGLYVAGSTGSPDFPVIDGAYSTDFYPFKEVFVSRMSLSLDQLIKSTFVGNSVNVAEADEFRDMVLYGGHVYAVGETRSRYIDGFVDLNSKDSSNLDVFVVKMTEDLALNAITYIGGGVADNGRTIYVDENGVYIAGFTNSNDFPTTAGAYQDTFPSENNHAFISRFDLDLNTLLNSTYLAGSDEDIALDIEGKNNSIYVAGWTMSSDFPVTSGSYRGGKDVFISSLSLDLGSLNASVLLGGSEDDVAEDLEISDDGVYVGGWTTSEDFPTTADAYDRTLGNNVDAFVSKYSLDLSTLLASTFLGGDANSDVNSEREEVIYGIALKDDAVYLTGATSVSDFPTTPEAYDTSYNHSTDAFVSKMDLSLSSLLASTFVGGTDGDFGYAIGLITVGGEYKVYITGHTTSSNLLMWNRSVRGYDDTYNGGEDVFVMAFDEDLSDVSYGTYLGGSLDERAWALDFSSSRVFVAGYTWSGDFPLTFGNVQLNGIIGTQGSV